MPEIVINPPLPPRIVHSDPEIMGGSPVFVGTRVHVKTMFDYLESETLAEFLDDFPTVTQEKATAALKLARDLLMQHAYGTAEE